MASHLEDALAENINKFSYFSLALDESTDISDTAQLAVFIRGVTDDFEVKEEFLDLASMKSTTIGGEDITKEVLKMSEKFRLDPKKTIRINNRRCTCNGRKTQRILQKFLGNIRITRSCIEPLYHSPRKFVQ